MYPDFKNLDKFNKYLDDNKLEIYSSFRATDLDCSYRIQRKGSAGEYGYPKDRNDFNIGFMFKPYDCVLFSWGLDKNSINEVDFIKQVDSLYLEWKKLNKSLILKPTNP